MYFKLEGPRENYVFMNIPGMVSTVDGKHRYPRIVLCDVATNNVVWKTRYEKYIIEDYPSCDYPDETIRKYAFCVVRFLNWMLHETSLPGLSALDKESLRIYFEHESKVSTPDYWTTIKRSVDRFLLKVIDCNKNTRFCINPDDLVTKTSHYGINKELKLAIIEKPEYQALGAMDPLKEKYKNGFLPYEFLAPFLFILEMYHPELVLAAQFQAYGGLSEGEVVNLSFDRIDITYFITGDTPLFSIDLSKPAEFWKTYNYSGKTNPGKIRELRKQRIFPDFVRHVIDSYKKHINLMKERGLPTTGSHPLFLGGRGKPMTERRYSQTIQETFNKYFIPYLRDNVCNEEGKELLRSYEHEYPGTRMLRHWFTMYLISIVKEGERDLDEYDVMDWICEPTFRNFRRYTYENAERIKAFKSDVPRLKALFDAKE